jgi:hypothetical protein
MADQLTLEILIKTALQGRGISATADEVKQLTQEIDKATPAGKQYNLEQDALVKRVGELRQASSAAKPEVENVEKATKKAGDAAQQTGKHVQGMGRDLNEGAAAGRILLEVLSGNFLALGQVGTAVKGLGVALKANLIGTLVTLGAVAAQFVIPFVAGFAKAKRSVEDVVDELQKAEEAGTKFANAKLTKFADEMELNRARAEAVRNVLREILELQGKRAEAEAAASRAKIDANPLLTDEQKTRQKQAIDEKLVASQREREDAARNEELVRSAQEILDANKVLENAEKERAAADAKLTAATQARADRIEKEKTAAGLQKQVDAASAGTGPGTSAEELRQNAENFQRLQNLKGELASGKSESQLTREVGDAKGELAKFTESAKAADEALKKILATNGPQLDAAPKKEAEIQATRKAEDEKRAVTAAQDQKAAINADAQALADFKAKQTELKAAVDAAVQNNDTVAERAARKALGDFNSTFKQGLTGADDRKKLSDAADQRAFSQHQVENTAAVDRSTAATSSLEKAIYSARPNQGGTITTPSGEKIDITASDSVAKAKKVDQALTDFYAPLDAQSSTVRPTASARQTVSQGDNSADVQAANNDALAKVADAVKSQQPLQPLDTQPLEQANAEKHQQIVGALQASAQKIAQLAATDQAQAQQIADIWKEIAAINTAARNAKDVS